MANTTNPESWAALERLRFIERSLWWRGQIKRRDLGETFGISLAQASSDLQRYLELNPTAARYDLKAKTYWGEPHMTCLLQQPRLEEALAQFLGDGMQGFPWGWRAVGTNREDGGTALVDRVTLPAREAAPLVQRAVVFGVLHGFRLKIDYGSLTGRRAAGWRWIVPRAFGHDGYRWHIRAWCEENQDHMDFVLSRIRATEWPSSGPKEPIPPDQNWETWEELILVPNPELPPEHQQAVEFDFAMAGGQLRLRVRRAMVNYTLRHLRLKADDGKPWLSLGGQ